MRDSGFLNQFRVNDCEQSVQYKVGEVLIKDWFARHRGVSRCETCTMLLTGFINRGLSPFCFSLWAILIYLKWAIWTIISGILCVGPEPP